MTSRPIESVYRRGYPIHASRRLPLILLDEQQPYFTDSRNETTASAKSMAGYTISVSFWMADPPGMSFFSVHCTKPPGSKSTTSDFKVLPHVVGAEGPFVLLRARFFSRYGEDEYFMYRVGDGELPSLEWIPPPDDKDTSLRKVRDFGIVPRCHGEQYLLAALCDCQDAKSDYQLQIYSSEKRRWSTRTLINPCPGVDTIRPEKVIRLEEGVLGWVDFSQGLLVCDLRQDPPVINFIPLPKPSPENREKLISLTGGSPRLFRDIACINGVLQFIEMTHFEVTENPSESSDQDCLYDVDLIRSLKRKHIEEKPKTRYGWRAVTWSRMVGSNCWRKGCFVDVADILVDKSTYSSLLSWLRGKNSGKLAFKGLYSAFPILSTNSDNILYLKSTVEPSDENGLVVAVDLGNMTLKSLGAYFFEDYEHYTRQSFRPCTLSCHLNITPGTSVSASHRVPQADNSANIMDSTSTCVSEPISGEPRCKIPSPLGEKINLSQNEAQSIVQNDNVSQFHSVQNNLVESTGKHQRVLVEEINRSQNEARISVQRDIHPVQNNLPPQQWHFLPGRSWWPTQSNLPPQQFFNKPTEPCDSGYASSGNFYAYVNHQPLSHQPPPSKQQLVPSSEFGHHKAPQPYFKCYGDSYHWNSLQVPPPNLFDHGTHSGFGNDKQQWQQLPPVQDLPALASWQQPCPVQHHLAPRGVWT